jgi:hypothetical protein
MKTSAAEAWDGKAEIATGKTSKVAAANCLIIFTLHENCFVFLQPS